VALERQDRSCLYRAVPHELKAADARSGDPRVPVHHPAAGRVRGRQFGLLSGRAPAEPGLKDGKLRPPSRTPNSVSSQAELWPEGEYASDYAKIEPLRYTGDSEIAMNQLRDTLASWPGARVVENRSDYIRDQYETRWLRFVDDAEFLLDPAARVIHVRTASRLGRKDFGVNRARIETLRKKLDFQ
jgi:uncharacterized protein (DUF1499 family)